jgi:hypothetical protein
MAKNVTFFMLVTERDCIIADYAIASYQNIYAAKRKFGGEDFVLVVYLNCLSAESKLEYLSKWKAWPYTLIVDNAEKLSNTSKPFPGEEITSPEGFKRKRDDYAESYDELWSTELSRFTTPFIVTVDADFEILQADFYFELMEKISADSQIIGGSSDYNETQRLYESYSNRNIKLNQRNHTWFCIYKKEAFTKTRASHFYFEHADEKGEIICYDSAAYFQEELRRQGLRFIHSEKTSSFVHYGASSKNRSLTKDNMLHYRRVFQLATIGLMYGNRNPFTNLLNKITRKIAMRVYGNYLGRFTRERSRYIYETEADQVQ